MPCRLVYSRYSICEFSVLENCAFLDSKADANAQLYAYVTVREMRPLNGGRAEASRDRACCWHRPSYVTSDPCRVSDSIILVSRASSVRIPLSIGPHKDSIWRTESTSNLRDTGKYTNQYGELSWAL